MQTLKDKLQPRVLEALQNASKEYPNAIQSILQDLENQTVLIDLRYGTVSGIISMLWDEYSTEEVISLTINPYNLFV
jgi:hypothetical protein